MYPCLPLVTVFDCYLRWTAYVQSLHPTNFVDGLHNMIGSFVGQISGSSSVSSGRRKNQASVAAFEISSRFDRLDCFTD